jgi:hypothetical protein
MEMVVRFPGSRQAQIGLQQSAHGIAEAYGQEAFRDGLSHWTVIRAPGFHDTGVGFLW